ncbi:phosducin-like protein [Plasmodium gonderi]|uniref:Phosducin-like protein n=1 Tax=Plasmodium gonderi TaxID=77519 RepID=A0A1Y1JMX1_PLAGO|nr:phosducin-like protein [Plasmodium gonderi]GAW81394.1 phosducin-like protein [Plasmodium gonderi]
MSTTNPTRETTEWDDLQRKFGNLPALEKEIKEEEIYLKNLDKLEKTNILEKKNLEELNLLEENCVDEEYLKIIEKYKTDRINEINRSKALDIYGDVYEISKNNFLTEINEASKRNPLNEFTRKSLEESTRGDDDDEVEAGEDEEEVYPYTEEHMHTEHLNDSKKYYLASRNAYHGVGKRNTKGTYVVIHLYSENVIACKVMNKILNEMAKRHKYIKFTKGIYNRIVENYPESKLPTILIYYNGICIHQICNLLNSIKGGLNNLNLKSFEGFLRNFNILKHPNYLENEHTFSDYTDHSDLDSSNPDQYADRDENYRNRADRYSEKGIPVRTHKHYTSFNIFSRNHKNDDYSSDEGVEKSKGYASSALDRKVKQNQL